MNERVNTSDWLEPIGEIFHGSCWCEVSMMLTYLEVPGVYVQPTWGLVYANDHVEAKLIDAQPPYIELHNPTTFDAAVRLLIDDDPSLPLPQLPPTAWQTLRIPAGFTIRQPLPIRTPAGVA
jgi:hypothetical protein